MSFTSVPSWCRWCVQQTFKGRIKHELLKIEIYKVYRYLNIYCLLVIYQFEKKKFRDGYTIHVYTIAAMHVLVRNLSENRKHALTCIGICADGACNLLLLLLLLLLLNKSTAVLSLNFFNFFSIKYHSFVEIISVLIISI